MANERYIDDPIVTGGCPQCGTYLYTNKRSERITSKSIDYGLNDGHARYSDKAYVRCGRCGFICNTKRDLESRKRAVLGWGMKYTEVEAGAE